MLSTYTEPLVGCAAVVPQLAPPCAPGMATVSMPIAGGMKRPPLRALRDPVLPHRPVLGREDVRVDLVLGERLLRKRRRIGRERLRRPRLLAGNVARRDGPLLDRPDRLAGHAIEDVEESGLARLRDDVDELPVVPDGRQLRRGGVVVVPEIVVDHLEMPEALARARVERDERGAEQVRADAGRRRSSRRSASRSGSRRCRAPRRSRSRPTCSRRRRTCRRPSARCRSRTRRDAERYGTATRACR